jgi:hypothetical protein
VVVTLIYTPMFYPTEGVPSSLLLWLRRKPR